MSNPDAEIARVGVGPSPTLMDYDCFREFLAATAKWATTDSPARQSISPTERGTYSNSGIRGRSKSFDVNGATRAADHEFMRRLFRNWDVDKVQGLSLQNVVNGMVRIKGSRDIMNTINYFFELYDDNGTGQVDREGILRMSEALLFLSRRGFDGTLVSSDPAETNNAVLSVEKGLGGNTTLSTEEKFLGSVSDFIRRCFEYADPSHPSNQEKSTSETERKVDAFAIGDDEDNDGDLIDLEDTDVANKNQANSHSNNPSSSPQKSTAPLQTSTNYKQASESANLALDPAHPLHITIPTFRMVILADELLEQFFETFFPQSFHLSDTPDMASLRNNSLSSNLTTFTNLGARRHGAGTVSSIGATVAGASGGIVPPGHKGLRGVLDNIVSDGMRMAAEVRKKMDEAQRELEENAHAGRPDDDDDEEDDGMYDDSRSGHGPTMPGGGRSSARDADRDLLEGAEVAA
ncbi:hypothetical protein I7I51_06664 [Histoplasma capsulatum]|uniref:EF-hand domain-containing protein n=1 Tax=Ajellomyces capsulatus TaxID=5037 RepID=A0A8A1MMA4_AJECA|nr:hypothetical protein I7I51_06664 [Histoplasma capsulatum]